MIPEKSKEIQYEFAKLFGWRWITGEPHPDAFSIDENETSQNWFLPEDMQISDIGPGEWEYYSESVGSGESTIIGYTIFNMPDIYNDDIAIKLVNKLIIAGFSVVIFGSPAGFTISFASPSERYNLASPKVEKTIGRAVVSCIYPAITQILETLKRIDQ